MIVVKSGASICECDAFAKYGEGQKGPEWLSDRALYRDNGLFLRHKKYGRREGTVDEG
jgi:hypothetical protein